MPFQIDKWDPSTIKVHPKMAFIGRSGSGKSVCLRDVLSHMAGKVDLCLCFSPTEESCEHFRHYVPASCVHQGPLRLDVIATAMQIQRELAPLGKQRDLLIVCDDTSYDKGVFRGENGKVLHDVAYNSRHQKLGFIYCAQYLFDIPPDVRGQFDYIIATADNQHSNKKKLWAQFGGVFQSYREFDAVFTSCTSQDGGYSCIVIDNTRPAASIESSIFWYKAQLNVKPFRLAKPIFWKIQEKRRQEPSKKVEVAVPKRKVQVV